MTSKSGTFWLDISGGETILTSWADDLCKKSAGAISSRVTSMNKRVASADGATLSVSTGAIEKSKGRNAKAPVGHRRAYYVRLSMFGKSKSDVQKILRKSIDAGKF